MEPDPERWRRDVNCRTGPVEGSHLHRELEEEESCTAIEEAVARIIRDVKELGFPISRIHSDSGAEFISPNMRRIAMRHHLKQTRSAPEEHNSNGRIENVVVTLKNQMRIYLRSPGADVSLWPLASRAVASMWRTQVRACPFPWLRLLELRFRSWLEPGLSARNCRHGRQK